MEIKNVIVIGASGNVGTGIISTFLGDERFNISVLTRNSSTATFPAGVAVHRIDDAYPKAALITIFKSQDAIISTMATASLALQKQIIDAAIAAGAKRFIPSEFGSDTENESANAMLPLFFKGKTDVVEYLKTREGMGEGKLSWSAFATGPVFELAVKVFMGFDLTARTALIYGTGNVSYAASTLSTIGLAVKNSLLAPQNTSPLITNKHVYISSFTVSQNQILAALEKATSAKWNAKYVDAEEQKLAGLEMLGMGDMGGAMIVLRYLHSVEGFGADFREREIANESLGVGKEDLEVVVAKIIAN